MKSALPRPYARALTVVLAAWWLSACGEERAVTLSHATLPPGVAARVGNDDVHVETVARIARSNGLGLELARDRAVSDALFAASVRADPARADFVRASERAALARALLENLREKARSAGPPSDSEVETQTRERWLELDRPESVRTTHAVVLTKSPADDAPARALAVKLADAVRGVDESAEFIRRAQALPREAVELHAEALPPAFLDGRIWDPTLVPPRQLAGELDREFTRAAHALQTPGQQSPIVKTAFGYHVILLQERLPALRLTLEERRTRLLEAVLSRRAKTELDALVNQLKTQLSVEIPRASDELTALVVPAP